MKTGVTGRFGLIGAMLLPLLVLSGCYSFRGGSVPGHLKTIVIPQVNDNTGSGRSTIRFDLTNMLIDQFRKDNSLRVTDSPDADSRLEVTISTLRVDVRRAVSSDDRETVRGVLIEAVGTFYDNVKSQPVYESKLYRGESSYDLAEGAAGEENAIAEALEQLTNDILLKTVAIW